MKRFMVLVSLVAAAGLLASCALIPPIPIGEGALGIEGQSFDVSIPTPASAGFGALAVTGKTTATASFEDADLSSLPLAPSAFLMEQGFDTEVDVTVTGIDLPNTITITDASELTITVSEQDPDGPDPVVVNVPFGPLVLERGSDCGVDSCTYTFADAEAALAALDGSISGSSLSRLLDIVGSGGPNDLELVLSLTVQSTPEFSGTIGLTVDVVENYIKF
jgi:hypothetical protein